MSVNIEEALDVSPEAMTNVEASLESALLDCLVALATLARHAGQPDRELRLREAVHRLRATFGGSPAEEAPNGSACHDSATRAQAARACPLTPREREVAALVSRGLSNAQIGRELVIAEATAERHVANIVHKLNLASRVELAAWFVQHRIGFHREHHLPGTPAPRVA